jgi:hypothetical protein
MRAALESLLRARKLDVTLTPFGPGGEPLMPAQDPARLAPTGCESLDAALGGGFRRGQLSEVAGAPSSGRTTVVVRAMAAATARGEAAALVDTCDTFDPSSAAAHGVDLSHLLWVRPRATPAVRVMPALKAFSLVLQAGGFGLAVFDLADVAPAFLRGLPATTWMRLARIIEGSDTVALLVGPDRVARSAGGATIACETAVPAWQGTAPRARVFGGITPAPRVVNR